LKEYIDYTEEEIKDIWNNATFVFDTNILLSLYRYSEETREKLLNGLIELQEKIWLPYNVAQEFLKNRSQVIYETVDKYAKIVGIKNEFIKKICNELRFEKSDKEMKKLDKYLDQWLKRLECNNLKIETLKEDLFLNKILLLFDGKVGPAYSDGDLKEIFKEGKERYEKKTPPGYEDGKKGDNAYGDFIIWKQIIDYAEKNKTDIIFVTQDRKEDWWLKVHGRYVGARYELRKEFIEKTSTRFVMYSFDRFLEYLKNIKDINIINLDDAITEVCYIDNIINKVSRNSVENIETMIEKPEINDFVDIDKKLAYYLKIQMLKHDIEILSFQLEEKSKSEHVKNILGSVPSDVALSQENDLNRLKRIGELLEEERKKLGVELGMR